MTAEKQIDPPDPPPVDDAPPTVPQLIATAERLTEENITLRSEIARRDAADNEWGPIKAAASLTGTPYSSVHRWKKDGDITWREANGRVEILLKSVIAHIRRLGR